MNGLRLVTGGTGFAGSHLLDLLSQEGASVVAWYRPSGRPPPPAAERATRSPRWMAVDLLHPEAIAKALAEIRPTDIFHCAGAAHVGSSWQQTIDVLKPNVLATHYLLEALRRADLRPRVLITGSALVYRATKDALTEEHAIGPATPYGLSKLAQELRAARTWTEDGLPVLLARPFNHFGPRQDPAFVTASLARQIALAEAGRVEPVLRVGNLDARRDLTDVRDTVRAYRMLTERGEPCRPYNICTGRAHPIRALLDGLCAQARLKLAVQVDSDRLRPSDQPVLLGDSTRIRQEIGWTAEISLERTLADLLDYWRQRVWAGTA